MVDNSSLARPKNYLAFDLAKILEKMDLDTFDLFCRLFQAKTHQSSPQASLSKIEELAQKAERERLDNEVDLKSALFGADGGISLLEEIGRGLRGVSGRPTEADRLRQIFDHSLYFVFRLLFLAYLEDRYPEDLALAKNYQSRSLKKISGELSPNSQSYAAWQTLSHLFNDLGQGELAPELYPLVGSLFDPAKTPLLSRKPVLSDTALHRLFQRLFLFKKGPKTSPRDFSFLTPDLLGTVYESALDFEFRVADKDLVYAAINDGQKKTEGYYYFDDIKDQIKNDKSIIKKYNAGALYLVNSRNSRKVSGSYYTPDFLAKPLIERGLAIQMSGPFQNATLMGLKLLDCSCGGGRLLLIALNGLTSQAQERLGRDAELTEALAKELEAIAASRQKLGLKPINPVVDELAALKRLLLKRAIYGVDISPFAVELTRLALLEDTFVFGAPPIFIERRVKVGNSLMGSALESVLALAGQDNSSLDHVSRLNALKSQIISLSFLNDTTVEEVDNLKATYRDQILPKAEIINNSLNFLLYLDILKAQKLYSKTARFNLMRAFLSQSDPMAAEELASQIQSAERYRANFLFFNWEIEFPEVFSDRNFHGPGFHLIVGNPPWDKTKFEDPLFFSQYQPNYRTLSNSQKSEIATALMLQPDIQNKYIEESDAIELNNLCLKARFPLSQGAGDNNLFRFFVERALSLLAPGGGLSYILPTALLTDEGSKELRKTIFKKHRLLRFDGFENRLSFFPNVHPRFKFGLFQIEKVIDPQQVAQVRFMLTDPRALETDEGYFPYSLADVQASSPKSWAYLEMPGGERNLRILIKLGSQFPTLEPRWLDFRRELDATVDKKIFKESQKPGFIPLYKGETIWHYQALAKPPKYWLDPVEFDAYLLSAGIKRLKHDLKVRLGGDEEFPRAFETGSDCPEFQLELSANQTLHDRVVPERKFLRLAFRAIASDTNERTLISALVPRNIGAQNSLWISIPGVYFLNAAKMTIEYEAKSLAKLLLTQALFNSLVVDWILRASVAMNVNKTFIERLPLPQPKEKELTANPDYAGLIRDSARLSLYRHPGFLNDFKEILKLERAEPLNSLEAFENLQAEVDVQVARLYGLDAADMARILADFKVLKSKNPRYHALVLAKCQETL
ncbi:MAG: hypothetical protein LBR11_09445 [Deltaproteobacteria bacterium]|nr:hypothetical protein [Deltaproteobacteria bacterium]